MDLRKSLRLAIAIEGIKHQDLAAKVGTSSAQISNWLREGNIKSASVEKLSKALNMKASEFVALGE